MVGRPDSNVSRADDRGPWTVVRPATLFVRSVYSPVMSLATLAGRLTDTDSKWYLLLGAVSLVKAFGLRHNRRRSRSELFDAALFLSLGLLLRYLESDSRSGTESTLSGLLEGADERGSKLSELLEGPGESRLSELLEESDGSTLSKLQKLTQESEESSSLDLDTLKRRLAGS